MRLLYLGSPAFAVTPLEALAAAGYELVGVVTQPDRPAGRQRVLTPPPVKVAAQQMGLPVLQPETLRDPAAVAQIAALRPDVGIVTAYGEILRPDMLAIPPLGYLNIHPSLLPLYRGPAPVAGAILAGDTETGVSIMQLDQGMDSGPILAQATITLPATARTGTLTDELIRLGSELLCNVLIHYSNNQMHLRPQDHSQATYTRLIQKADGRIDWSLPAVMIERMTRAYDPWPGTFSTWHGQQIKILEAAVHDTWSGDAPAGTIVADKPEPLVATGSGALALRSVQPAGKRSMPAHAWLLGQHNPIGERFGT